MQHSHPKDVKEAGEDIILEAEEDVFPEEYATTGPQTSLVKDRIRTPVSQVVTCLISKKYNVII